MTVRMVTAPRASRLIHSIVAGQAARRPDCRHWLVPANACDAVYLSLMSAGASFDVVDIREENFCLDVDQAIEALGGDRSYAGLIYIHGYGASHSAATDIRRLRNAAGPELVVIDDRCLCPPSIDPEMEGLGCADAVVYSTGHGKVLDLGAGGYALVSDGLALLPVEGVFDPAAEAGLIDALRTRIDPGLDQEVAVENRIADWLASWLPTAEGPDWPALRHAIERELPAVLAHKSRLNEVYRSTLPAEFVLAGADHLWRYNLRVPNRDRLLERIFDAGLFASAHFRSFRSHLDSGQCPVAHAVQCSTINLFNDKNFSLDQATRVSEIVVAHLAHAASG
ncbi:hypothetical protein [Maricaulis sp.]|uniref:hypothetical protein n=1 Tax=Maricaulis sp. TaxID=1486257 RepID=UPI002B2753A9|nr:hypothetical protein [Maricaulis sp.]